MRTLPLNPKKSPDSSAFAPIYDPELVVWATKVTHRVGIGLTVALVLLFLPVIIFALPKLSPESSVGTWNLTLKILVDFVGPFFFLMLAVVLGYGNRERAAYSISTVNHETEEALREWLSVCAGDFSQTKKEALVSGIQFLLADGEESQRNELYRTAEALAKGTQDTQFVIDKTGKEVQLQVDADGFYRVVES